MRLSSFTKSAAVKECCRRILRYSTCNNQQRHSGSCVSSSLSRGDRSSTDCNVYVVGITSGNNNNGNGSNNHINT